MCFFITNISRGCDENFIILHFQVMQGVKEITRNSVKFVDGQEREFDAIILATGYTSNVPTWLKVKPRIYLSFCCLPLSFSM